MTTRRPYTQIFLDTLPTDQTYLSNARIREELGWDEDRYNKVKDQLVEEGHIERGPGRGGTVRRVPEVAKSPRPVALPVPAPHSTASPKPQISEHVPAPALPLPRRPTIFIGSSREGYEIAERIQAGLKFDADCTIWSQGVFGLSQGSLEALVNASQQFDYAVLVLTPDDLTYKRQNAKNSPRDNVLFELGLFMGALGRERTFIVYDKDKEIDLPSDLAGVTPADFLGARADGNLQAALGPACRDIKDAIKKHPPKR